MIHYLTKSYYAPLLHHNPYIDKLITLSSNDSLFKLASKLQKESYHYLIDLHHNIRSNLLRLLIHPEKVITTPKRTIARRLLVYLRWHSKKLEPVPELHLSILQELGIQTGQHSINPQLFLSKGEKREAEKLGDNLIVMDSRSRWENKKWGLDNYLELAGKLASKGYRVLLLSEKEKHTKGNIEIMDIADWRKLMVYIYASRLTVTNDTVSSHIASAFQIPSIVIFGPTSPDLGFAPSGKNVYIKYSKVKCSPCSVHGGNFCLWGRRCMRGISVREVFEDAQRLLQQSGISG